MDPARLDQVAAGRPWVDRNEWPAGRYRAAYLALGLLAGFTSALFGGGSGVVIVAVLAGLLGVPMKRAAGTSIVAVSAIVATGVVSEAVSTHNIDWLLAIVVAIGAQLGVRIGGAISRRVTGRALRYVFAGVLALSALKLAGILPGDRAVGLFDQSRIWSPWIVAVLALGAASGIVSVLLGIGGGIIIVPGLLFLITGLPFQAARATSLATMLPTALAGSIVHARHRDVLWRSAILIVATGLFGAILGVITANVLPGLVLKHVVFPIFLAVMILRLVTQRNGG